MKLMNIYEEVKRSLYHGTNYGIEEGYYFFSTSKHFAENYGEIVYGVDIDLGKVFDSTNIKHIEELYRAGIRLQDDYIGEDDYVDEFEKWGVRYDRDYNNLGYVTAQDFIKATDQFGNTWEPI